MERIAILAGGGQLPTAIADSVKARGGRAHIVAIEGAADAGFGDHASTRVGLGQLQALLTALKSNGDAVVVAGHLSRPDLLRLKLDRGFFKHLPEVLALLSGGDDAVLSKVVRFFERRGLKVVGLDTVAPELIAGEGVIAGDSAAAWEGDAQRGFEILDAISDLDIGQAIVVRDGRVLAIEGLEGTDRMLSRVPPDDPAPTAPARGVLVKAPKRGQELRIDLPAIGPQTIVRAGNARLAAVIVQAGRTVVVDRAEVAALARVHGLTVRGVADTGVRAGAGALPAPSAVTNGLQPPAWSGRALGRLLPTDYDRVDALKGARACERLRRFGAGSAACVVRSHVLGVSAADGPVALAGRLAAMRQWSGQSVRRRRGAFVLDARGSGAAALDDIEVIIAQLVGSSIRGVAVLRQSLSAAVEISTPAIAAADAAGLFLIDIVEVSKSPDGLEVSA